MKRADLDPGVRANLVRLPAPHNSHYAVVPSPPPETGVSIASIRRRHDAAVAALQEVETYARSLHDPFLISRVLARQEAVSSSSIEGTNSTLDELLSSEETQDEATTMATRQVRRYAVALDTYVRRAAAEGPDIFDLSLVRRLHKRVMRDDHDYLDVPGRLRQLTVWIGSRDIAYSTFNPPPAAYVAEALQGTLDYMRGDGSQAQQQSLLTRMALAHAHFEAVHPFRDGNGRVGRLLLPLMMAADGRTPLYLSPYIEANKLLYADSLKAAQQRLDWAVMVGFICDAVVGTARELMLTRAALSHLHGTWLERRRFREGSSSLRALDMLPHFPVMTVGGLAGRLEVTYAAAAKAIGQLSEIGVLRERTGYLRNRVFVAPEALSVLNRPFGYEPMLPTA